MSFKPLFSDAKTCGARGPLAPHFFSSSGITAIRYAKADADPGITGTSKDWEGKSKNVQFQVKHPSKIE